MWRLDGPVLIFECNLSPLGFWAIIGESSYLGREKRYEQGSGCTFVVGCCSLFILF